MGRRGVKGIEFLKERGFFWGRESNSFVFFKF